ncbi:hypothetical protein [Nocardia higoensis]|uniref:hypothetical protein n=1 Tax=Nocardia higoensis TaxID=228599 RepID=UPI0002E3F29E|nr:hypothetical protein [Nocardia higoensis]
MNYDHVLLPSGVARTPSEVDDYLTAQQGLPQTEAVTAMAAIVDERNAALPEEDSFLADNAEVGGSATGSVLHVACPYDAIGHVRALLFEIGTPRGYALYDPQLAWLIDPADRVEVTVSHGGAGEFPYLTETLIHQWVPELAEPNPYLIAEREPQHYIQTYRTAPGEFAVEYRDGGPDRHYALTLTEPRDVAALIWAWARGDQATVDARTWERVEF